MFKKTLAATAAGLLAVSLGAGTAAAQDGEGQVPAEDDFGPVAGSLTSGPLSDLLTEEHVDKAPTPTFANCTKGRYAMVTDQQRTQFDISECEENTDGEWTFTYRTFKDEFTFLEGTLTGS